MVISRDCSVLVKLVIVTLVVNHVRSDTLPPDGQSPPRASRATGRHLNAVVAESGKESSNNETIPISHNRYILEFNVQSFSNTDSVLRFRTRR